MRWGDLSEEELVSACLARRAGAWEEFVRRFSRLIHWCVRKTLEEKFFSRRTDVAEDAFQEVFRKLLEGDCLRKLEDPQSLPTYLRVMACFVTMDKIKTRRRFENRFLPVDDHGDDAGSGDAPGPALSADRTFLRQSLDEIWASLSPKERLCLELSVLDGRTHDQIAVLLATPQNTVSSLIRRLKDKIKADLKRRGIEGPDG